MSIVQTGIEDEVHFLLYCSVYDTLRQKNLPRKYFTDPNMNKFNILMSSKSEAIIQAVASYMYLYFQIAQRNT